MSRIKLKILKAVRVPKKQLDNIIFRMAVPGFPTYTLFQADDFYYLVNAFNALHPQKEIPLELVQLAPKEQAKQKFKFDEQGSIIQSSLKNFELNRPSDRLYTDGGAVTCAFCQNCSDNIQLIQDLGPFYGPFHYLTTQQKLKIKKTHFVHLMCAIWTPNIYLDSSNKMKNLKSEIMRSAKVQCSLCHKQGGGLGCKVLNCKNSYHYSCALQQDSGCSLDYEKFTLYCRAHQKEYESEVNPD